MAQNLRSEVLKLYRRILRTAISWEAKDPSETLKERTYIREEARELFKKNKNVTDELAIKDYLLEGEARLEMAIHYRVPYPRPVNLPPMSLASKGGKGNKRRKQKSRPVYIKSIDPT